MIQRKFYSDITKKFYDVEDEAEKAEILVKKQEEERLNKEKEKQTRIKEVEDAYKKLIEAKENFRELENKFVKDYGSLHLKYTDSDPKSPALFDYLFDVFHL